MCRWAHAQQPRQSACFHHDLSSSNESFRDAAVVAIRCARIPPIVDPSFSLKGAERKAPTLTRSQATKGRPTKDTYRPGQNWRKASTWSSAVQWPNLRSIGVGVCLLTQIPSQLATDASSLLSGQIVWALQKERAQFERAERSRAGLDVFGLRAFYQALGSKILVWRSR